MVKPRFVPVLPIGLLLLMSLLSGACGVVGSGEDGKGAGNVGLAQEDLDWTGYSDEEIRQGAVEIFDQAGLRIGATFTGQELIYYRENSRGAPERVYENVVMWVDIQDPTGVRWLDLPQQVNITPTPLVERLDDERYYFWLVQGTFGHNVPLGFWDFILQHGGPEVSGAPITEVFIPDKEPEILRQCFGHLCLDYQADAPRDRQIRVAALGKLYTEMVTPPPGTEATNPVPVLVMEVSQADAQIEPGQSQEIAVILTQDGQPVSGIVPILEITMPAGNIVRHQMPRSGSDGHSSIRLPPFYEMNGTLIPYQVCVAEVNPVSFCVQGSFVIWSDP